MNEKHIKLIRVTQVCFCCFHNPIFTPGLFHLSCIHLLFHNLTFLSSDMPTFYLGSVEECSTLFVSTSGEGVQGPSIGVGIMTDKWLICSGI